MQLSNRFLDDAALYGRLTRVEAKLDRWTYVRDDRAALFHDPYAVAWDAQSLRLPMDELEVAAFEKHHDVRLPSAYRQFILRIGDGGVGPYFGLLSLSREHAPSERVMPIPRRGYLSSLCPLHPEQPRDDDWVEALPTVEWHPYQGSIILAHQGGNRMARLIVSGEARGRIVNVDGFGIEPPCFTSDRDFLAWYERWLDDALAGDLTNWGRPDFGQCQCTGTHS